MAATARASRKARRGRRAPAAATTPRLSAAARAAPASPGGPGGPGPKVTAASAASSSAAASGAVASSPSSWGRPRSPVRRAVARSGRAWAQWPPTPIEAPAAIAQRGGGRPWGEGDRHRDQREGHQIGQGADREGLQARVVGQGRGHGRQVGGGEAGAGREREGDTGDQGQEGGTSDPARGHLAGGDGLVAAPRGQVTAAVQVVVAPSHPELAGGDRGHDPGGAGGGAGAEGEQPDQGGDGGRRLGVAGGQQP